MLSAHFDCNPVECLLMKKRRALQLRGAGCACGDF